MSDLLTGAKTHAQTATKTDLLTGQFQAFTLACRVELRPDAAKSYTYLVGRFINYCMDNGIIDAGEVRTENVRMFYLRMQETNNATSIRTYHRHIQRFFNWLVQEGFIEKSPVINAGHAGY